MDDRAFVTRLLKFGVEIDRASRGAYATPADDAQLRPIGTARLARWLEELGRRQLVGDVQPCFTSSGASFRFQVTDLATTMIGNAGQLKRLLDELVPEAPEYEVFLSYAAGDAGIAGELSEDLRAAGCRCFMAEKDIHVAAEWQETIRAALLNSKSVLVLLTPRSLNRPWVLMETGAAWALGKPLIPALSHVAPGELLDPLRRYQAYVIETTAQRKALVAELTGA